MLTASCILIKHIKQSMLQKTETKEFRLILKNYL